METTLVAQMIKQNEETLRSFALRTITLGVNLIDCIDQKVEAMQLRVNEQLQHVLPIFRDALDQAIPELSADLEFPIVLQTRRVTITPLELLLRPAILDALRAGVSKGPRLRMIQEFATEIDETVRRELGSEGVFLGGCSQLAEKGLNQVHRDFLEALPDVLKATRILNASFNVGTTRSGIDLEAVRTVAAAIERVASEDIAASRNKLRRDGQHRLSAGERKAFDDAVKRIRSKHSQAKAVPFWSNLARVAVFVNAPSDNPFMAGGYQGPTEPEYSVNVGINGAGVVADAIERCAECNDLTAITQAVKEAAAVMYTIAELVRQRVVLRFRELASERDSGHFLQCRDIDFKDGIVDLSLASTDHRDEHGTPTNSVAEAMRRLGVCVGGPGTLAALALLIDSVKKAGCFRVSYYGGLSGTFIPISEDAGMSDAVAAGTLTFDKYMAMTSVCSVGVDMVPVYRPDPPQCTHEQFATALAGVIADEAAIGVFNNKVTSVRLIPVHHKPRPDRWVVLLGGAGLLGAAPVVDLGLDRLSVGPADHLVAKRGKIAPPLTSLTG
jgi:uncharacterized protein (UPF0210 family)